MPSNQAAWLVKAKTHPLEVSDAPYNSPEPNEIVLKNHAVAINPVDYLIQDMGLFVETYPAILGCDCAGVVEEVGSDVKSLQKGDRVIGHALGLVTDNKSAAFQAYTVIPEVVACKVPSNISFESAVVLPLAVNTAAAGLYEADKLALPLPEVSAKSTGKAVLVYGGSSSVGTCVIQLARASGVEVITTASARNHDLCKSLGASHVFDYNDKNFIDDAAAALKGKEVVGAYDAISKETTLAATSEILEKAGAPKFITTVLRNPGPDGVKLAPLFAPSVAQSEIGPHVWQKYLPLALENGSFKPKPDAKVVGKGLGDVQKAIDELKKGVSASKIVVSL